MIKDVVRSIDTLGMGGTIAVLLFLAVFTYWCIAAFFLKKTFQEQMSHLPLENDSNNQGVSNE